jgi:hypothetical protein
MNLKVAWVFFVGLALILEDSRAYGERLILGRGGRYLFLLDDGGVI